MAGKIPENLTIASHKPDELAQAGSSTPQNGNTWHIVNTQ